MSIKYCLFLIIIVTPCFGYSQIKIDDLRLGLKSSFVKNIGAKRIVQKEHTGYNAKFSKLNYKFGINIENFETENVSFRLSVNYLNLDFIGTYFCDVCDFVVDPVPEKIEARYIEVPVSVYYYFGKNKLKPFLSAGINNSFILKDYIESKRFHLSALFNAGLDLKFESDYGMQFYLGYQTGITSIFYDAKYKEDTAELGLMFYRRF